MTEQEEILIDILNNMRMAISTVLDKVHGLGNDLNQNVYMRDAERELEEIDKSIDALYWMYRKDEE